MNTERTREQAEGHVTASPAPGAEPLAPSAEGVRSARSLPPGLRAGAPAWIWVGTAVVAVGFILIAVGWARVAGESQVYRQLPLVVSAAVGGLGFVLVGLTVLNIVTRQRDGADRDHQLAQLIAVIEEYRGTLEERERR